MRLPSLTRRASRGWPAARSRKRRNALTRSIARLVLALGDVRGDALDVVLAVSQVLQLLLHHLDFLPLLGLLDARHIGHLFDAGIELVIVLRPLVDADLHR